MHPPFLEGEFLMESHMLSLWLPLSLSSWLLSAVRTHHAQAQPELRKRRPSAERAELHFHTCSATWRPSCAFL